MKNLVKDHKVLMQVLSLMLGSTVATVVAYRFLGEPVGHFLQALVQVIQ